VRQPAERNGPTTIAFDGHSPAPLTRLLTAVGLVCLLALARPAGQQTGAQAPTFRGGVDLVHLDVSVLDRDRRPVRGLTPADFTILENGQPQQISVFTAVEIDPPEPPATEWMREVAPDVRSNEGIEERRLFLLILDDAMIQGDPQALTNAKQIGRRVIEGLGPSDLAAVVFTRDNRNSQDYTADRARLLRAIDTFTLGFRDMSGIPGMDGLYFMYSTNVVQNAVKVLSTLPDRRKSVIYVGQGLPVDLDLLATPQAPGLAAEGGASGIAMQGEMQRSRGQMGRTFEDAARANVNVYTIDICGLRVPKPRAPAMPGALPPPPPTCQPGLEVDYLQTMAEQTNARAVINTNDFEPGIQAIFDENASYYLLGYQPAVPAQDGRFRRIDVRVNRPGVEVRTRSGYQPEKPADAARRKAELAKQPLGAALSGVLPKSDLPLTMTAVPVPLPGRKESAVAIVVGVRQPIRVNAARTIEKVDLQVSAFNTDGKAFGSRRLQADVAIRGGATGLAEYEVLSSLELRPGRYQLRIAANVGSLSTSGSLYYDIEVPDVGKAPITLLPLVMSATPGPATAPRDGLRSILPVVPTTRRAFGPEDRVAAFTRVHQRESRRPVAVPLRIELRDQTNAVVFERQLTVPAGQFAATRFADVRVELPTGSLAAGDYLLTIHADVGERAVQSAIRFAIRR
jgi:VWFA-related protein